MTIPTDGLTDLKELINSDSNIYSGKTEVKRSVKIKPAGGEFSVKLSPFSGRLFDGEVFSKPAAK